MLWLFLQGRWKRGAFEIMWEETKQNFLVALKHSEEIECSVCLDNVLSKPTTPKRRLAVLPKCGPSIVHIMYRNWCHGSPTSRMTLIYSIHQESNHIYCNCLSNICTYIIVMISSLSKYLLCAHNNYVFFSLLIYIYPLLILWF